MIGFPTFLGKEGSWIERPDCFQCYSGILIQETFVLHQVGIGEVSLPMAVHERHHCLRDLNMEFLSQGEFICFLYEEDSCRQSPEDR
jgi:hypothetical protein